MPVTKTNRSLSIKFGIFCREKREALGLTLTEAAILIFGNSNDRGNLKNIESGTREISFKRAEKILEAYDSDIEFKENH